MKGACWVLVGSLLVSLGIVGLINYASKAEHRHTFDTQIKPGQFVMELPW